MLHDIAFHRRGPGRRAQPRGDAAGARADHPAPAFRGMARGAPLALLLWGLILGCALAALGVA